MKRIGAICRMDFTGLGIQSKEFFDNIPCKAFVIDSTKLNGNQQNPHWFPGQTFHRLDTWMKIPDKIIDAFLKDIDVLITFETPYDYSIFEKCRRRGIKTFLQLNYEFLEYPSKHPYPDLFVSPSLWHYNDIPDPKIHLPVPVNTKYFTPKVRQKTFIHVAGRHAIHDRNGTMVFINSLRYVINYIDVYLYSQMHFQVPKMPPNINLKVDFSVKLNYHENFHGGVLVMPRKFGGLCLPVNEALAAEMPVIMTDISPNNQWLPKEWLVPAHHTGSFKCKTVVDIYEANARDVAAKIDEFCEEEFYNKAVKRAAMIKRKISWDKLRDDYLALLGR